MGPNNNPRFRARKSKSLFLAFLLFFGIGIAPAFAQLSENCIDCHGTFAEVHGNVNHNATPGSGQVVIFADFDHDSAAWNSPSPQFGVVVNCGTCHIPDLIAAHGNNCATCHPQPYRSLGTWQGGCQQGGCHATYHEDSIKAHKPFADPYAWDNCGLCHGNNFQVTSNECLNCHATYGKGNLVPPVTTANALATYIGPARIDFSITSNGKVAVGTTFYSLNGGDEKPGLHAFVSEPGFHEIEFWSVDQDGNFEPTPKKVSFTVTQDTEPPTTTSDAKLSYTQGGLITLTATDNSTLGVKNTYYRLDDGSGNAPIQTGAKVTIPATNGFISYTLTFWSEDWSGNVEPENIVNFSVTSGSGTIRLVWGDSDVLGSPCPDDPEASANWTVLAGNRIVASGSGSCPGWSGVDDILVQVGSTQYLVIVEWWDSSSGWDEETWFPNVMVTTPGQVVRLSY